MWRGIPAVTVDATSYVEAHPGEVASMGVCLLDRVKSCDEAFGAGRDKAPSAGPVLFELSGLDAGTYRIRVALDNAAGQRVLTTTGELAVHYTDGGRCKNLVGDHGTARVDAHGRISST